MTKENNIKHERRVVGHASGWQEQMNTCVCGKPWPCSEARPSKPLVQRIEELVRVMRSQRRITDIASMALLEETVTELRRGTVETTTRRSVFDMAHEVIKELHRQDMKGMRAECDGAFLRIAPLNEERSARPSPEEPSGRRLPPVLSAIQMALNTWDSPGDEHRVMQEIAETVRFNTQPEKATAPIQSCQHNPRKEGCTLNSLDSWSGVCRVCTKLVPTMTPENGRTNVNE